MAYRLAVDLGTSSTLAAVTVDGGRPQLLELGTGAPAMPSVVYLGEDGSFLVGEEAEQRGDADPSRVAREFQRRLGEETPVTVAGQSFSPQALLVVLLQHVVATATSRYGGAPAELVLAHPAGWDDHRRQQFDDAVTAAGVGPVTLCPGLAAVATAYAAQHPLEPGARLLVYDLGGTLDVGLVEREATGFAVRGRPEHSDAVGGAAFDEAVYRLVLGGLGDRVRDLDPADRDVVAGLARLRRECVQAKEALSTETATSVRVELPAFTTTVRVTRPELVPLIRPALRDSAAVLDRVLRSASVTAAELAAVVLVGGSSRIPAVAPLLERELGHPVVTGVDPTQDLVLGSLLIGQPLVPEGTPMPVAAPPQPVTAAPEQPPAPDPVPVPVPVLAPAPAAAVAPAPAAAVVPEVALAAATPAPPTRTWLPTSAATPVRAPSPELSIPTATSAPTAPDSWLSAVLADSAVRAEPGQVDPVRPVSTATGSAGEGPSWSATPPGGGQQPPPSSGYTGGPPPGYSGGPPPGYPSGPAPAPGGQPPQTPGGPRRPAGPPPSGSADGSRRRLLLIIGAAVVALVLLAGIGILVVRAVRKPDQVADPVPQPVSVPASVPVSGSPSSGGPSASTSTSASATGAPTGPASGVPSASGQQQPGAAALPTSAALPLTTVVTPMKIDGERDLYLVDTTKRAKPLRLPTPDGSDGSPVLPPQRNTIIYLNQSQLRVMAADGTGDRSLTDSLPKGCELVNHLAWSPTDTDLLVLQCESDKGKYSFQEVHLDGTLIKRLNIAKDEIHDVSISSDGLTLVYWASNNPDLDGGSLYSIPVDGSDQPTRLTKEAAGTDADPVWSPDGSQIAFRRRVPNGTEDGNYDVYVMNFDGSDPEPVAETPASDVKPSWSPDGKQLLVVSNRDSAVGEAGDTWDLWLTRVKDGRVLRSMGLKAELVTTPYWNSR